jgi:hypothetical protein
MSYEWSIQVQIFMFSVCCLVTFGLVEIELHVCIFISIIVFPKTHDSIFCRRDGSFKPLYFVRYFLKGGEKKSLVINFNSTLIIRDFGGRVENFPPSPHEKYIPSTRFLSIKGLFSLKIVRGK